MRLLKDGKTEAPGSGGDILTSKAAGIYSIHLLKKKKRMIGHFSKHP